MLKRDMTQKEFSEYFGIPYRTVTNWDSRECMPDYVENIINCYIGAMTYCKKLSD